MKKINVKDIALIAILSTMIVVQEQLLSFIPNVQFTVFLIVLFSKTLGLVRSSLIVLIHTVLDNLIMGSFNIMFFPFMLIGWMIIPITLNTIFKKVNNHLLLALLGVLFSFIYCWLFIIPNVFILNVNALNYFIADILFELIMATSSFISIAILYNPLQKAFLKLLGQYDSLDINP